MKITKQSFGKTKFGDEVTEFFLENKNGMVVGILDYGCIITKIIVKNVDICLGYDKIQEYEEATNFFGAAVGRYANRIGNAKFQLNGEEFVLAKNDGENHLHGGNKGFDKFVWDYWIFENEIQFTRLSKDMEEGYPGNLQVAISYALTEDNELVIKYNGLSDKDTVINLTNHCYFNLAGHNDKNMQENHMEIYADEFLECDNGCLPTGEILSVSNTPFDFRKMKKIGEDIDFDCVQLNNAGGFDHNWILSDKKYLKKAAVAKSEKTGICMSVFTTQPGIQFYTGNFITKTLGKGCVYNERDGFCLETQKYPNSPNVSKFPSTILKKGEFYNEITIYKFS